MRLPERASPKDVCTAWIRLTRPELTNDQEIQVAAKAFFDASPTGELWHVFEASAILRGLDALEAGIQQ